MFVIGGGRSVSDGLVLYAAIVLSDKGRPLEFFRVNKRSDDTYYVEIFLFIELAEVAI